MVKIGKKQLFEFINRAGEATYAGGGEPVENPERPDFKELVFDEGNLSYRDSYTGHSRSRGMEVVRENGVPIWSAMYGGGMVEGKEEMASETFGFLKKALSTAEENFQSFRGPHNLEDRDWKYTYIQEGDVDEFNGYEEIHYRGELVFYHRVIGGNIKHKK